MRRFPKILLLIIIVFPVKLFSQQTLWTETFDIAEKGFWGGGSDMSAITKWSLDASGCILTTTSTYIKTVATSGGRMEAKNIKGEAVWTSEIIDISSHSRIDLSVAVSETGSSNLATKYVKVYYILNGGAQIPFDSNSQYIGDFGSAIATQSCLSGSTLQIVIKINNPNSADATIFDNVTVKYDDSAPTILSFNALSESLVKIQFSEPIRQTEAETIANYNITGIGSPNSAVLSADKMSVQLNFSFNLIENQNYTINISNVSDKCGNTISPTLKSFTYSPFKLENVYNPSKNELLLEFSHFLDKLSAETVTNYFVNSGINNPTSAILEADTMVHLFFANNFVNQNAYIVSVNNLHDNSGITLIASNGNFTFHQLVPYDLAINEIMADPSPVVGLPEFEYIEIFNKTNFDICMWNWKLRVGETLKTIPLNVLKANSYMLISSYPGTIALNKYVQTIGILASTDLTNSGKQLALISNESLKVDSVNYSDIWYQNSAKDDGGWSLERIDPDNSCGKINNWKASVDPTGGTPGKINSIDNQNIDNLSPKLLSIHAISANQIQLNFSEEADNATALNINTYILDNLSKPKSVSLVEGELSQFILTYANDFSLSKHKLQIFDFKDLCGNTLKLDTSFTYYPAKEFDIVINEILADNSPAPNVLPASKYLEIYNKTDLDIDLTGWTLQIGDNEPITFLEFVFNSHSHLIICSAAQLAKYQNYGNAIGILSESQLLTSGTSISIFNKQFVLIDYVQYADTWYSDESKANGGWSLERLDVNNYCGDSQNWKASTDYKGGTPGHENSVKSTNPDASQPIFKRVTVLSSNKLAVEFSKNISESTAMDKNNYVLENGTNLPQQISLADSSRATIIIQFTSQFIDSQEQTLKINNLKDFCGNVLVDTKVQFTYFLIHPTGAFAESYKIAHLIFSEEVDIVSAQNTANYTISNGFGKPSKAYKHSERKNEVYLEFPDEFTNENSYTVHIENIKDLSGNSIKPTDLPFTYFHPSFNDLIINEILFNPKSKGFDFVEIYNKSEHEVELSKISLASRDETGELSQLKVLSGKNALLPSGHFLAISSDTIQTKKDYPAIEYDKFIQIASMPSFSDDKGVTVLLFADSIIDEFAYNDNMHFSLITNTEGISLERIDPEKPTQVPSNWASAAENVGFATPANQNSQFRQSNSETSEEIKIEPETFSPNNDGFEDQLFINYQFTDPGYVANVTIYDSKGLIIKKIASNEILSTEGTLSWDGLKEDNSKARIGIYLIYFEIFNLKGEVKKYKKVCVLAGRLD